MGIFKLCELKNLYNLNFIVNICKTIDKGKINHYNNAMENAGVVQW